MISIDSASQFQVGYPEWFLDLLPLCRALFALKRSPSGPRIGCYEWDGDLVTFFSFHWSERVTQSVWFFPHYVKPRLEDLKMASFLFRDFDSTVRDFLFFNRLFVTISRELSFEKKLGDKSTSWNQPSPKLEFTLGGNGTLHGENKFSFGWGRWWWARINFLHERAKTSWTQPRTEFAEIRFSNQRAQSSLLFVRTERWGQTRG